MTDTSIIKAFCQLAFSKIKIILTIFFITFTVLGLWAFWIEPSSLTNKKTVIKMPHWPRQCNGLKVVVLTDLHVGSPFNGLDNLVKVVKVSNELKPDLILLAGDYVIHKVKGGQFVNPELIARELRNLKAKLGVYAVLGNHDWWYSVSQIKNALKNEDITLLENTSIKLNKQDCDFWLTGIGDFWGGHYDIKHALKDVPDLALVIAFTHNPDIFYELPKRIAITFAGHTHGGQVNLPIFGRTIVPSRYDDKFAIGHISEDGRNMFVSPGIGTSIIPIRFRVPPEISMIELTTFN